MSAFAGLLALYVGFYHRFALGLEVTFHDTMWDHHAFYAVLKQWLDAGLAVGWNPFMNGGEPLYLYSNLFLWAELVGFVALNWVLGLPTHELINLYFTFVLLSFATLCFVLFSVVFRERVVAFYAVIPILFGGLTASTLAQYMLSPLYLLPAALLAAYLLLRDRDPAWLLGLVFLGCVSANHYLPHYLALSIGAFLAGGWIARGLDRGPSREDRRPHGRLRPATVAAALVVCAAAVAPALFVHREARALVSPTRGNVEVTAAGLGVQPGVHQSLDRYRYLVRLPRMDPADASWENLEYAHGVFYIGWIPVLLALLSPAAWRRWDYRAAVIALGLLAVLALGDGAGVWSALKAYMPLFYLRHAYPLSVTLTLLVVTLSAYGFARVVRWRSAQLLVCALTLGSCLHATREVHGAPGAPPPFELAPIGYPTARAVYADPVSRVPVDSGPLITKRAAATHVNDDFVLFRTRPYQELIQRDLPFAVGPILGWTRALEWRPAELDHAPNEIENGSFERWGPESSPAGFGARIDGGAARPEQNRDPRWVRDGHASVRMALSPGATATLTYTHPRVVTLRGRFLELSACLASPSERPIGVVVTVLQPTGHDVLTPHTYRGRGAWECLRRVFLVAESADGLELSLAVSSRPGAVVFVDALELRPFPGPARADVTPAAERWLVRHDPSRIVLGVEAPEDGYLVRKENYHPGWSASVDGHPTPIERYAGAFQAIRVARGAHTVVFTFTSPYPFLMWAHVVAAFAGYLAFYGHLVRTGGALEVPR